MISKDNISKLIKNAVMAEMLEKGIWADYEYTETLKEFLFSRIPFDDFIENDIIDAYDFYDMYIDVLNEIPFKSLGWKKFSVPFNIAKNEHDTFYATSKKHLVRFLSSSFYFEGVNNGDGLSDYTIRNLINDSEIAL